MHLDEHFQLPQGAASDPRKGDRYQLCHMHPAHRHTANVFVDVALRIISPDRFHFSEPNRNT